jgi:hypothetical protein
VRISIIQKRRTRKKYNDSCKSINKTDLDDIIKQKALGEYIKSRIVLPSRYDCQQQYKLSSLHIINPNLNDSGCKGHISNIQLNLNLLDIIYNMSLITIGSATGLTDPMRNECKLSYNNSAVKMV